MNKKPYHPTGQFKVVGMTLTLEANRTFLGNSVSSTFSDDERKAIEDFIQSAEKYVDDKGSNKLIHYYWKDVDWDVKYIGVRFVVTNMTMFDFKDIESNEHPHSCKRIYMTNYFVPSVEKGHGRFSHDVIYRVFHGIEYKDALKEQFDKSVSEALLSEYPEGVGFTSTVTGRKSIDVVFDNKSHNYEYMIALTSGKVVIDLPSHKYRMDRANTIDDAVVTFKLRDMPILEN